MRILRRLSDAPPRTSHMDPLTEQSYRSGQSSASLALLDAQATTTAQSEPTVSYTGGAATEAEAPEFVAVEQRRREDAHAENLARDAWRHLRTSRPACESRRRSPGRSLGHARRRGSNARSGGSRRSATADADGSGEPPPAEIGGRSPSRPIKAVAS